ncbi:hypothetical protein M409DRAFT_66821 [Zasmidium cellare ATCC 36951]|uniref:BHLH domain-containing protein n=1 Tax=Zasmidium cellare ATCC 36951 TaxID=1080233 RepID=A0A6A6CKY3_ZASCE|nr:uncharacterized protein M409DRAFT_66821 [Zasmidium cellare ATCC 36951]KAF2166379.1 hypothetical protein M409DRAFT_66821 [Zasmidium cellare ATCC 36951]
MATTSTTTTTVPNDCFPSLQCLSGIVPEECKKAGVACATTAMKTTTINPTQSLSPQSSVQSPENHISPIYAPTPASTGSQAITTSSDSEHSQSGRIPTNLTHHTHPHIEERPTPRPTRPHRRIPHTIIERRYRDNLNTQIETLRLSLPSLKNAYVCSPDVEDSALPPRLPSKAMIIATAATYIKEVEAERNAAFESVRELQAQVGDLQRLVSCGDCSILQYLQAVGGGGNQGQGQAVVV